MNSKIYLWTEKSNFFDSVALNKPAFIAAHEFLIYKIILFSHKYDLVPSHFSAIVLLISVSSKGEDYRSAAREKGIG